MRKNLDSLNQSWWKLSTEFCPTICKLQFCFPFKWQLAWWWHLWQLLLFELLKLKRNQWCSIIHKHGLILGLESLIRCNRLKGRKRQICAVGENRIDIELNMMIMILVICAQCGIQYLMTIYPPLILPLPIKPTKKHQIGNWNSNVKCRKTCKTSVNDQCTIDQQ